MPKVAARAGREKRLPSRKSRPVFGDVSNDNRQPKSRRKTAVQKASTETAAQPAVAPVTRRRSSRLSLGDNNAETTATRSSKQPRVVTDARPTRSSSRTRGKTTGMETNGVKSSEQIATRAARSSTRSTRATEIAVRATSESRAKQVAEQATINTAVARLTCSQLKAEQQTNSKDEAKPSARRAVSRGKSVQGDEEPARRTRRANQQKQTTVIEQAKQQPTARITRAASRGRTTQSEEAPTKTTRAASKNAPKKQASEQSTRDQSKPRSAAAAPALKRTTRSSSNAASTRSESAGGGAKKSATGKRRRQSATNKGSRKAARTSRSETGPGANAIAVEEVEKPGKDSFPDFLPETDYSLVSVPFDASKYTRGVAPVDLQNRDDPAMVTDYVTDIFQRLYHQEDTCRPGLYMTSQPKLNPTMRAILIDWLVEVHAKFRLVPETLYLCVNIIDRYLSVAEVERSKLQLIGVTALLIACKYEEIYPPELRDCVYITDRAYSRQNILDTEVKILDKLKYKMTVPTGHVFLQRFLHITKATNLQKLAANYYMERMLQEYSSLKYKGSEIAAACVCLALNNPDIIEKESLSMPGPGIPHDLLDYTGFDITKIVEIAGRVGVKVSATHVTMTKRELSAVKKKYREPFYRKISTEVVNPHVNHIANIFECEG